MADERPFPVAFSARRAVLLIDRGAMSIKKRRRDMKTPLVAAGILVAATLSDLPTASAKDLPFGLTIAGPHGVLSIGTTRPRHGAKHRHEGHPGDGYGHRGPGHFDLWRARASGYCLYPRQIRRRLRHRGWRGFRVIRHTPRFAIVRSHRYGEPFRLKVDRCSGELVRARPAFHRRGHRYW